MSLPGRKGKATVKKAEEKRDSNTWRMGPLNTLPKPVWSTAQNIAMISLRGYLVVTALVLVVKIIAMALGG